MTLEALETRDLSFEDCFASRCIEEGARGATSVAPCRPLRNPVSLSLASSHLSPNAPSSTVAGSGVGCWEEPVFGLRRAGLESQLCLRGVPTHCGRLLPAPQHCADSRDDLHENAWQTAEQCSHVSHDFTSLRGFWTSAFPDTHTQMPAMLL